ncbi:hypothetical protein BJV78DRAFT_1286202 [Lactifluus subvellereus]|nr:hypothetical protein BJV78DRAFT_1286202 [Lactifluus subvellereus]
MSVGAAEAEVDIANAVTQLEVFTIGFQSPVSLPDRRSRCPPSLIRAVVPTLIRFEFEGVSQYLEDLVARIDAPILDRLGNVFFNQPVFDVLQTIQFVDCAERLSSSNLWLTFFEDAYVLNHLEQKDRGEWDSWDDSTSRLSLFGDQVDVDHTQWLEHFLLFTSVQTLYARVTVTW